MSVDSYFYGPVPSRRLGFSLGVDLFPKKICSFDCLYCQLGQSGKKTIRRLSFVKFPKFKRDLREIIKKNSKIDYITISGSGEPTLHKDLDKIIAAIKRVTKNKYPVAVITNSSLLYRKKVRRELLKADLIVPSLDAATVKTFSKLNRPHKGVVLKKIIEGLIRLRREFKGKIWLEIMLVAGINDNKEEIKKLKQVISRINPDKIQLNLPIRPAGTKVSLPSQKRVENIKKVLSKSAEIVTKFSLKERGNKTYEDLGRDILNFLKVRPASLEDLIKSLGVNPNQIIKQLYLLLEQKLIKEYMLRKTKYFMVGSAHTRPVNKSKND